MNRAPDRYPPADRGKIIVWGLMASLPFGGMIWQALHYLVGLRRLGFDVWYVEDSDRVLYDPVRFWPTLDYEPNVAHLDRQLESVGLEDRWIFRPPGVHGLCLGAATDLRGLQRLYEEADAAINLCGAQEILAQHREIRRLIYVQTDPAADQVKVANGIRPKIQQLTTYDALFTYGENVGTDGCRIPVEKFHWHTTRPPVIVDWWRAAGAPPPGDRLTTIANWKRFPKKAVTWMGERWSWDKQDEIRRFIDLPRRSELPLELALGGFVSKVDQGYLREHGWHVRSATDLADPDAYRRYINESRGELSIAKEQYVLTRSGWFSDRSVCYLAAGRPVITQNTGFGRTIPTGEGLFAFDTEEEALAAIESVAAHYERHAGAARQLAAEYFASDLVLTDLVTKAGLAS